MKVKPGNRVGWYLALGAVVADFTVSGNLLSDLGTNYISDGGTVLQKIHPGSYLAIASGVFFMLDQALSRRVLHVDSQVAFFLGGIALCAIYAVACTGAGNVVVLIDTFFSAGVLALTLGNLSTQRKHTLRVLAQCLLILNAGLSLFEVASHAHLVPLPGTSGDTEAEFRPTALYDHPLTGAAVTMLGLWLAPTAAGLHRWCYLLLLIAAMLAFGERGPLAAALAGLLIRTFGRFRSTTLSRDLALRHLVAVPVYFAIIVAAATTLWLTLGAGTRLGAHLTWDDSAQVRLSQYNILNLLSAQEVFFGCPRADLLALVEPLRLSSRVAVIENFWLFTFVTLGLFCFPVFLLSFGALLKRLWTMSGSSGHVMIVLFVAVASTSNSLGRKSTLLVTLVACVTASSAITAKDRSRALQLVGRSTC